MVRFEVIRQRLQRLDEYYLDLDREIVYRVLQEGLEDIAALRRSFAQFL